MRSKQFLHQDAFPASLGLFPVQWSIRLIHDCATNDFRNVLHDFRDDVVFLIFLYQVRHLRGNP